MDFGRQQRKPLVGVNPSYNDFASSQPYGGMAPPLTLGQGAGIGGNSPFGMAGMNPIMAGYLRRFRQLGWQLPPEMQRWMEIMGTPFGQAAQTWRM